MSPILSVENLNVVLEGEHILKDINFDLQTGESLAVIGPNGSGKTVLLKALLKLLPHQGKITWQDGVKIGYVPQKIEADRHLPITLENLLLAKTKTLNLTTKDYKEVSKTVGLSHHALQTPVGHLSGGQFQKGLIALALLGNPQVILLDEPTASLDQPAEEHIYELIQRLQKQYQLTVIIISHDISMVHHKMDKVLCLNKQALCFGDPEEILRSENLEKLFGAPFEYYDHIHDKHANRR